jgi:hypothetical protein
MPFGTLEYVAEEQVPGTGEFLFLIISWVKKLTD